MDAKITTLDDLLAHCFGGEQFAFSAEFAGWLRGSRRFKTFVMTNRGKIRAKLKSARDEPGLQDVRAELQTAMLLFAEDRFTLQYEAYAASKQRGPDFTVTFKTHTPFNVEVRRMRSAELRAQEPAAGNDKLAAVLCDKVGQMPPSIVNLLWLVVEGELAEGDIIQTTAALRQRAESKDEEFFTQRGFKNSAHFLKQCSQLSGVVLQQTDKVEVWLNPSARHKTPPEIVTAIGRLGVSSLFRYAP